MNASEEQFASFLLTTTSSTAGVLGSTSDLPRGTATPVTARRHQRSSPQIASSHYKWPPTTLCDLCSVDITSLATAPTVASTSASIACCNARSLLSHVAIQHSCHILEINIVVGAASTFGPALTFGPVVAHNISTTARCNATSSMLHQRSVVSIVMLQYNIITIAWRCPYGGAPKGATPIAIDVASTIALDVARSITVAACCKCNTNVAACRCSRSSVVMLLHHRLH